MTTTLRIAVRQFGPFERAIARQFDDFVRTTGADARLETEVMDLNPLHEALFTRRELAGGRWDIAFLATDWLAQAQSEGLVEDLAPWLERAPIADFPEAWSPSLTGLQRFAGGIWGMPYHDGPECLVYRRDLLEAAGIGVPGTWDEFHAAARALHAPEREQYGTVLALFPDGHNSFYDFCIHVWSRGGEPFDRHARPNFTSSEAIEALNFIRMLATDDRAIAAGARDLDSVRSGALFADGKVALMANWFGFAAFADTDPVSKVKGLIDVAPLPAGSGPGGKSVSLNVFWVLALASGSANKALAWEFLRHAATPQMDKITTMEGAIGVRRSTWADPEVNARVPYYHRLDWLHEHARELPLHPRMADVAHEIDRLLDEALSTSRPSAELLAEAQARVLEIVS
jgi:multiple sugar transport system substrate-binding protein